MASPQGSRASTGMSARRLQDGGKVHGSLKGVFLLGAVHTLGPTVKARVLLCFLYLEMTARDMGGVQRHKERAIKIILQNSSTTSALTWRL